MSDSLWWGQQADEPGMIMALNCYLDDSENQQKPRILGVGGFMADSANWVRLSNSWQELLLEFGLYPEPGYFHMTDFENRVPPYDKWPENLRIPRLQKFLEAVGNAAIVAVGTAIIIPDYDEVLSTEELRQKFGSPYAICAQACMNLLGNWSNRALNIELIHYFLEVRPKGNAEVREAFDKAFACKYTRYRHRLGSIVPVVKTAALPIQAADIAAYETPKQLIRTLGIDARPIRRSFAYLVQGVPYLNRYFDKQVLTELLTAQPPHVCDDSCFE